MILYQCFYLEIKDSILAFYSIKKKLYFDSIEVNPSL